MKPEFPIGLVITEVRKMTDAELRNEGWEHEAEYHQAYALVLSDGSVLYPSMDYEGNGPGALFGVTKDKEGFSIG